MTKCYRLGYTETTLLYYYYKENILNKSLSKDRLDSQYNMLNWLYSTSGFYDKKIKGTYFDFDALKCKNSEVFNEYMKMLICLLSEENIQTALHLHPQPESENEDVISFRSIYGKNNQCVDIHFLYRNISGKTVVLVNPISDLLYEQYSTGKLQKIYPSFPEIKGMLFYQNIYTFLNEGPDDNLLKTSERIVKGVKELVFDIPEDDYIVIVSCGAYSNLISSHFKNSITIGRWLLTLFGIKNGKERGEKSISPESWLEIPEDRKPKDYKKIEEGCYW